MPGPALRCKPDHRSRTKSAEPQIWRGAEKGRCGQRSVLWCRRCHAAAASTSGARPGCAQQRAATRKLRPAKHRTNSHGSPNGAASSPNAERSHSSGPTQTASKSRRIGPADVATRFPPRYGSPWSTIAGPASSAKSAMRRSPAARQKRRSSGGSPGVSSR